MPITEVVLIGDKTCTNFAQPTANGALPVTFAGSNYSAFGVLQQDKRTPLFQTDFIYGLNNQRWQTAVTSGTGAAVTTDAGRLSLTPGTSSTGYAYLLSRKPLKYREGQGIDVLHTPVFDDSTLNQITLFGAGTVVSNDPQDGYFFGRNTDGIFGIAHYIRGTPTWYKQSDWNVDKVNGTDGTSFSYDCTKGSPVMIKYPYLGYGDIFFFVQNPDTGAMVLVHIIKYANTVKTTQLGNPNLNYMAFAKNSGNTTSRTVYCGSVGCFLSGERSYESAVQNSADSTKTGVTTETNFVTIKNATTYNGVANRRIIRLTFLSFGSNSNSYGVIRFKINATLGGSPSYTTIDGTTADGGTTITSGNSVASVDVAGTTVTGGSRRYAKAFGSAADAEVELETKNIYILPGETMTISVTGSVNTSGTLAVNWVEE